MHAKNTPSRGFSLIEMAIIAMVIGVIVATILPAMFSKMQRDLTKRGKTGLTTMRDEILGFAAINGNLPALSSLSIQNDVWGNPFTYIVARKTAGAVLGDSLDGLVNVNDVDSTNLSVVDGSTGTTLAQNVAFVLASRGPDSQLQISESGASTLNHVVTVYPNGYSDATVTTPFDDIAEYAILSYAKGKAAASAGKSSSPAGSTVSFSSNIADFTGDSTGVSPSISSKGSVAVDTSAKTITMTGETGHNFAECVWYQGSETSANCTNGVCEWGGGLRAYFDFVVDNEAANQALGHGGGFTFAIITNTGNSAASCGAKSGAELGYSQDKGSLGGGSGVKQPKLGFEFDLYQDAANLLDPARNHAAIVYWTANSVSASMLDNQHSTTQLNSDGKITLPTPDSPTYNPSATLTTETGFTNSTSVTWLEDGISHSVRIEVYANLADKTYNATAWIDCTGSSDLIPISILNSVNNPWPSHD